MGITESTEIQKMIFELQMARSALDGVRKELRAMTKALEEGLESVARAAGGPRGEL